MNDPGVVVAPRNGNRGPDGDGMKESGGKLLRHADAAVRGGCAGTGNVARMQSNSGSGQAHPVGQVISHPAGTGSSGFAMRSTFSPTEFSIHP